MCINQINLQLTFISKSAYIVQFQKISIPTQGWSLEIPRGMGVSIAQIVKRKYEAKLKIPGGGRVQTKEPSLGEVWIFFGTTPCGTKPVLQKNLTRGNQSCDNFITLTQCVFLSSF